MGFAANQDTLAHMKAAAKIFTGGGQSVVVPFRTLDEAAKQAALRAKVSLEQVRIRVRADRAEELTGLIARMLF